ncbi:chromate transporter [Salsuginibacillus kocurii]|uniref:chromate transporter n=1 Tax=Salsuginibacillus kocurii TaxID=427078 RepID=UPI0003623B4B|nr:chromate transporter [Salsuginibacillus kocurii]
MNKQAKIFLAFFRPGILGYGGGPAAIPLVHKEVVETYEWMDDEEFADVLALGNTLPGPIITKLAGYIGYRIGGTAGMINAIAACVLPTAILMIVLLAPLLQYRDEAWVQGMLQGVIPVVGVMLLILTIQFFMKGKEQTGWLTASLLGAAGLLFIGILSWHPVFIIGAVMVYTLGKKKK